jgi:Zn-dependent peptidase ImmA (M78 family)
MKGSGVMRIKIMATVTLNAVKSKAKMEHMRAKNTLFAHVRNIDERKLLGRNIQTLNQNCINSRNLVVNLKNHAKIKKSTKEVIEQIVAKIFCVYGAKCYKNISALANLLGIKVGETINIEDNDDGFIYISKDKENKVIGVNNHRSLKQKRFIVAHELGHYFLNYNENDESLFAFRENKKGKDLIENQADYFAACLLMPADIFSQKYISLKKSKMRYSEQEIVNELSDEFCVPNESVIRRIEEVGCDKYGQ